MTDDVAIEQHVIAAKLRMWCVWCCIIQDEPATKGTAGSSTTAVKSVFRFALAFCVANDEG
jgi:hypothetical protein